MDPLNSIWYFLEFQRQSTDRSSAEALAKPKQKTFLKGALIELGLPLFVLAVIITFGVVCFLCPTFVS